MKKTLMSLLLVCLSLCLFVSCIIPFSYPEESNTVSVTGVTLDKIELTLTVGDEDVKLTATVLPDNATNKNVTWTSNTPSVATVDNEGKVHAVAAGEATITVTTVDGNKTATCYVKVTGCLAAGTMITMEDGSRQAVETLELGDMIKTFDHETGEISTAPICACWAIEGCHGSFTLHFTDNIAVSVVQEHCFFDRDTNRYEVITCHNASEYVGHYFYNADEGKWEELLSVEFSEEPVTAYYIFTAKHYNHFAEGMLSLDPIDDGVMTYVFDFGENLKFDEDKMLADIEKYGLMTLEEMPYVSKEYFDALNMQYLKIAYGKGLAEKETVEELIRYYMAQDN